MPSWASSPGRAQFDHLAARGFADITPHVAWTTTISMVAEVAAQLHDAQRAAVLYELLLSHASRLVIVANLWGCNGAVDRYLGMLAATCMRLETAETHFG